MLNPQTLAERDRQERQQRRTRAPAWAPAPQDPARASAYSRSALEREAERVASTPEESHCRNATLNKAAFSLGQLVGGGELLEADAIEGLTHAAQRCGLGERETEKTIASGMAAGRAQPRQTPERLGPNTSGAAPHGITWAMGSPALQCTPAASPRAVIAAWRKEGPLVRIPTGIAPLDRMCDGGLPCPWRCMLVGAPSAGKTALAMAMADHMARASDGPCVGILGVDEEPDDLTVRLVQMAGWTVAQAEQRDPSELDNMAEALAGVRVRLYDATHRIESAAADLATWAKAEGRRAALFLDSLQAVRSELATTVDTPRALVEANVAAIRAVSTGYRLLVVATSEANRASYRSDDAAAVANDLASGAESRAIEFGAQTLLMLRTPKGEPDVIHANLAKNRRAERGEFWLRLDRDRHSLTETGNPAENPAAVAERREQDRAANRGKVKRDATDLAGVLRGQPQGLGTNELRAQLRIAGVTMGRDRLDAAKTMLANGLDGVRLVNRGDDNKDRWVLEAIAEAGHG